MENEAKAPAQCERHVICDAAAYKEQALPERSELETPPVAFICATRADRPAAAATAASAADCVMGGAAERPGGGVGSFLREASRLSSASARESKTSGCILQKRKMCPPVALQLNELLFHASLLSWRHVHCSRLPIARLRRATWWQQQLHACVGDANSSRVDPHKHNRRRALPKQNTSRTSRGRGNLLATSQ